MRSLLVFLALAAAFTADAKTTYVHPGQKKAAKAHPMKQSKSKFKGYKAPKPHRRGN
jgi:hypothetical protein